VSEEETWNLIHAQRALLAVTLATLTPEQWGVPSLCEGWSIREVAGHVVAGAEQTTTNFLVRFAASLFRFNVMTDTDARRVGALDPDELIARLRMTVTTTNHPPAPIGAMLGEVVAHTEDICQPLGLESGTPDNALVGCLEVFTRSGFPLGSKKRVEGLTLSATDLGWNHGSGPTVEGPGKAVMLAMVGRTSALKDLSGDGVDELRRRIG
jgi:uncharacterized protein (TIGR03083 family)